MTSASSSSVTLPPEFTSDEFRRRRTQNWIILGLLYAFFYMTRYNFAAVMPDLASRFGWTNTDLGVFETLMPAIYGPAVFINGPLCDRIGGKKAFLIGAVGVVVMNFLFGFCTLLVAVPAVVSGHGHAMQVISPAVLRYGLTPGAVMVMMATIWGINGFFQSFGALSIVKVNASWFHMRERGMFSGIFGVLIRLGLILAFSGVPIIATVLPINWAFMLPGTLVAVLFVLNYLFMENSPKDAGFGEMDTGDGTGPDDGKPVALGFLMKKIVASKTTWLIAVCSMMIGMVRRSVVDSWYPKYFTEVHLPAGISKLAAFAPYQAAAWGIALLGIAGGFAFGYASDRIFNSRRAPVITVGFIGMAVTLVLFGLGDRMGLGPWASAGFLALLSFFVNGSHGMIGGAASMDFGGKKAAATAAGLFDGMQYLASAFVGVGMGWVLDHWGWKAWQFVPIPFAIIGAILIAQLWNVTPAKKSAAPAAPAPEPGAGPNVAAS
jgi:OPA family glycerol-3-phosphate transporter-like MFS transporter